MMWKNYVTIATLSCLLGVSMQCLAMNNNAFDDCITTKQLYSVQLGSARALLSFACASAVALGRHAWSIYKKQQATNKWNQPLIWGAGSFFVSLIFSGLLGRKFFSKVPGIGPKLEKSYQEKQEAKKKLNKLIDDGKFGKKDIPPRVFVSHDCLKMLNKVKARIEEVEKKNSDASSISKEPLEWQGSLPEALQKVISQLSNPKFFADEGITLPTGILMRGKPGTGKTFAAKYIAQKADCGFMYVKTSRLKEKWVGSSEENVEKIYTEAQEKAEKTGKPVIVFLDEFDSLGARRDPGIGGYGDKVLEDMQNTLLQILDGKKKLNNVVTLMATNKKLDFFDPALSERLGRIRHIIKMPLPNEDARLKMLMHAAGKFKCAKSIPEDFWRGLAHRTDRFTPDALYGTVEKACETAVHNAHKNKGTPVLDSEILNREFDASARMLHLAEHAAAAPAGAAAV